MLFYMDYISHNEIEVKQMNSIANIYNETSINLWRLTPIQKRCYLLWQLWNLIKFMTVT